MATWWTAAGSLALALASCPAAFKQNATTVTQALGYKTFNLKAVNYGQQGGLRGDRPMPMMPMKGGCSGADGWGQERSNRHR